MTKIQSIGNTPQTQEVVKEKKSIAYKPNFKAGEDQFVRQQPVMTRPPMMDQQTMMLRAMEEQKKKQKRQEIKNNVVTAVSVLSGLTLIGYFGWQFLLMRGKGGKVPGEFSLNNLKFLNLSKNDGIADLKNTKTLAQNVQEFFVNMLETDKIKPKYITRAGLGKKGFPNAGLLLGQSGTGKTESVKMYAKAKDAELLIIKLGDFANPYVDGTATNMTKMFTELDELFKKNPDKRYVILFDEADGIAKKLQNISADKDYLNKNRQSFLTGCDIIMPNTNVDVFAATNVPLAQMDEAVISRFGRNIEFELPNADQLVEGLKFHLKDCKGLKEGSFDFFETQKDAIKSFADEMVNKKYAFRDLQKMVEDAQASYARAMNKEDKDLLFDVKYLQEALKKKGLNAAQVSE